MSTIASIAGRFFVVPQCVPWIDAEAAAVAAGGTLATLTSSSLLEVAFAPDALDSAPACAATGHPGGGPIAWIGSWNDGVPLGTVLGVDLVTRRLYADNINSVATWSRLVLAQPGSTLPTTY